MLGWETVGGVGLAGGFDPGLRDDRDEGGGRVTWWVLDSRSFADWRMKVRPSWLNGLTNLSTWLTLVVIYI